MYRVFATRPRLSFALVSLVFPCALAACGDQWNAAAHSTDARSTRVGAIVDFHQPESVKYDPEQDIYFVTNMNGFGSAKDNNGYISRVNAADINDIETFVQGGADGVALNAPKGTAIHGDTLWVCDIDVLRGFDRHGGAPLASIDLSSQGTVGWCRSIGRRKILVSSRSDSAVHLLTDGHDERLVRNVPAPADIGVDTKRGLVLVPLGVMSRVELWAIPKR